MAFFLKKSTLKGRTYLSIVESYYSPQKHGGAHRTYKSLASVEAWKAKGIDDPIAYFQKEVDELNKNNKNKNSLKISDHSPELYLGYFPFISMMNKMDIKKMTALAMFSVIALTIFTAESMIGPIVPIPGIKLGLANIVTLLVLVLYGPKEALFVLIVRILLGSMFGGQMISFFYSLSGGVLCWLVMSLISALLKKKFLVLISMCGAAAHNIGQILAAIVITQSISVVAYFPVLMLSAMITGCFTGLAAQVCSKRLQKILKIYFE